MDLTIDIRHATHDDYEAVVELTSDIWADRGGDYLPDIYHDWLEDDEDNHKKTFLAETDDGDLAGIVQAVMLSPDEAWFQTMRVSSDYRRQGVSQRLNEVCFEWARERGATVGRIMIFSWNTASLAAARVGGFEPVTEFRWAHPDPDPDPNTDPKTVDKDAESDSGAAPLSITTDPTTAWRYWTNSETHKLLCGLALSPEESWALRELTRADLEDLPVFAVSDDDGACGMAYRNRTFERTTDAGNVQTTAEYGVAAWDHVPAARTLFVAIARDAGELGADRTRVCIPETVRTVSDAAMAAGEISEEPDFVLEIDLS